VKDTSKVDPLFYMGMHSYKTYFLEYVTDNTINYFFNQQYFLFFMFGYYYHPVKNC